MTDIQPPVKQVLLAEEEPMVRNFLQALFHSWGFRVFSARNGREALEVAAAHKGEIDLLVSDVTIPEIDGQELAAEMADRHPNLKVILLSGYSKALIVLRSGWKLVKKPFQIRDLKGAVEDILK
jgi:two-component system, cell cycle sensor histidine kinase and response regulator CckA